MGMFSIIQDEYVVEIYCTVPMSNNTVSGAKKLRGCFSCSVYSAQYR